MIDEKTPVMVLLYHHSSKKDSGEGATWMGSITKYGFSSSGFQKMMATEAERLLLREILAMNSRLLPNDFNPKRVDEERNFKLSCFVPVGPLSFEDLAHLNADQGCALCGAPTERRCTQCQSVSYCGKGVSLVFGSMPWGHERMYVSDCQLEDWPDHKTTCRSLKAAQWVTVRFRNNPPEMDGHYWYNLNKLDDPIKLMDKPYSYVPENQPPPNIHGNKLFAVKLQLGQLTPPTGPQMMVYDRRRSFLGYIMRNIGQEAAFDQLKTEMQSPRGGHPTGLKMYRWAKRVSDWELSICVDKPLDQSFKW